MEIVDYWGDNPEAKIVAPVRVGEISPSDPKKQSPRATARPSEKNRYVSYFCTNDVIKAVPVKDFYR